MSDQVVNELLITVQADIRDLTAKMNGVEKSAEKAAKSVKTSMGSMGKWVAKAALQFAKLSVAVGTGVAVAFTAMVVKGGQAAEKLQLTADSLNITATSLRELQAAGDNFGVTAEKVNQVLAVMNRQLGQAAEGNIQVVTSLAQLGLSIKDLVKLAPDEQFKVISEGLSQIQDPARRATIATDIFGRASMTAMNFVMAGKGAIDDSIKSYKDLNTALSETDLRIAADMSNKMGDLELVIEDVQMAFAAGAAPAVEFFIEKIKGGIVAMGGLGGVAEKVGAFMAKVVRVVGDLWQGFGFVLNAVRQGWDGLSISVNEFAKAVAVAVGWWGQKIPQAWELVKTSFDRNVKQMGMIWYWWRDVGYSVAAAVVAKFGQAIQSIGQGVIGLRNVAGGPDFKELGGSLLEAGINLQGAAGAMKKAGADGLAKAAEEYRDAAKAQSDAANAFASSAMVDTAEYDKNIEDATNHLSELRLEWAGMEKDIADNGGTLGMNWGDELKDFETKLKEKFDAQVSNDAEVRDYVLKQRDLDAEEQDAWLKGKEARYQDFLDKQRKGDRQAQEDFNFQWKSSWQFRYQFASGILGNLATLQDSTNRKTFEFGKAAAIGQAIVDTLAGATNAFRTVPYPFNFAAAASVAVAGFANVQKIRSTKFGGGGGGGGGAGGSPASSGVDSSSGKSAGASGQQSTNVNISLIGDRFNQRSVRDLTTQIAGAVGDNVKFNVKGN